MREIKFRGKFRSTNRFMLPDNEGEWVYGDLLHDAIFYCDAFSDAICSDGHVLAVDSDTIGQFTGLRDKNGREIYEGDIIKIVENLDDEPYNSEVKFYKGVFGVENWTENTRNRCLTTLNHFMPTVGLDDDEQEYTVEVLGNKYENSDLLDK